MQTLKTFSIFKYSIIVFPLAFAGIPIYIHAPDYYSTNLGIKIEAIGISLLILRLLDAFLDPLIGYVSDKFFYLRDKFIYIGAANLLLGFWMIFHPLNENILLWFILSVFICTLGFSMVIINVQAFGGVWNIHKEKIVTVMTIREGISLIGLLIASITPPLLFIYFKNNNFHILSIILIVLTALSLIFFYSWHRAAEIKKPANNQKNRNFRKILKNPRVKLFFTSYFFNSFATSIPATIIIFYVRDYLNAESYLGLFLLIYFLSGAASMPLWKYLSNKFSSIYSWFLSMIFAFLSFIWAFFLEPNNIIGFFIICLLSGIAVGANLALPSAIIAEDINSNNNQDYASSYYSISNFLSKFALAIASGVSLPILGFLGYVPGIARNDVLLPFVYAFLPCCILLISIYLTSKLLNKSSI